MPQSVPSVLTNMLFNPAAEMHATPLASTHTRLARPPSPEPMPSWPKEFDPTDHNEPSFLRNRVWFEPAAVATTPVEICTGELRIPNAVLPSSPKPFEPMPQSVPSVLTNTLWESPAAALITLVV